MAASSYRLGLIAGALGLVASSALLFAPGLARKTDSEEISLFFHGFQDSRGVTVLSPTIDLSKDFTDRTSLKFKFGVDAISASSDSCARCHPDGIRSGRAVGSLSVNRKYGDTTVGIGGELSQENFYRATTLSTTVSRTLNQANTTIAGGYSFSINQPVLHPSEFAEKQYAGPTNRFWGLLYESGLVPEPLTHDDDVRLPEWGIGMTNLIARPSPGIDDLSPAEYLEGWKILEKKIELVRPDIVAFVGVTMYRALWRVLGHVAAPVITPGFQKMSVHGARLFVLPNPSGRNAHFSYDDMLRAFRGLARAMRAL